MAETVVYQYVCADGKTSTAGVSSSALFTFDEATGKIGIDTDWVTYDERNHAELKRCVGYRYLSPYWTETSY